MERTTAAGSGLLRGRRNVSSYTQGVDFVSHCDSNRDRGNITIVAEHFCVEPLASLPPPLRVRDTYFDITLLQSQKRSDGTNGIRGDSGNEWRSWVETIGGYRWIIGGRSISIFPSFLLNKARFAGSRYSRSCPASRHVDIKVDVTWECRWSVLFTLKVML